MKKKIVIPLFLALLCVLAFVFVGCKKEEPIGTISGAEYEYLTVGNAQYELCLDSPYHSSDSDKKIGIIKSGDMTFHVYSVKGTDQYLYCRWEYEGSMYKLVQD